MFAMEVVRKKISGVPLAACKNVGCLVNALEMTVAAKNSCKAFAN